MRARAQDALTCSSYWAHEGVTRGLWIFWKNREWHLWFWHQKFGKLKTLVIGKRVFQDKMGTYFLDEGTFDCSIATRTRRELCKKVQRSTVNMLFCSTCQKFAEKVGLKCYYHTVNMWVNIYVNKLQASATFNHLLCLNKAGKGYIWQKQHRTYIMIPCAILFGAINNIGINWKT